MSDQDSLLSKLVSSSAVQTVGMCRVGELESTRNKLQAKIVESEELVDSFTTKVAKAEMSKTRTNNELDDLAMEYERGLLPSSPRRGARTSTKFLGSGSLRLLMSLPR